MVGLCEFTSAFCITLCIKIKADALYHIRRKTQTKPPLAPTANDGFGFIKATPESYPGSDTTTDKAPSFPVGKASCSLPLFGEPISLAPAVLRPVP